MIHQHLMSVSECVNAMTIFDVCICIVLSIGAVWCWLMITKARKLKARQAFETVSLSGSNRTRHVIRALWALVYNMQHWKPKRNHTVTCFSTIQTTADNTMHLCTLKIDIPNKQLQTTPFITTANIFANIKCCFTNMAH